MCPILQWLCSASGGKVSCWSARSQSHQKKPQCCRTYESFRVFSVMCIKSSFTIASEGIPCLGFIKTITCQNREPDWERNSALPSLSPGWCPLWQKRNGCGTAAGVESWLLRKFVFKLQAQGGHTPLGEQWGQRAHGNHQLALQP